MEGTWIVFCGNKFLTTILSPLTLSQGSSSGTCNFVYLASSEQKPPNIAEVLAMSKTCEIESRSLIVVVTKHKQLWRHVARIRIESFSTGGKFPGGSGAEPPRGSLGEGLGPPQQTESFPDGSRGGVPEEGRRVPD